MEVCASIACNRMLYFQLTLNNFIRAVLSKFTILNECVDIDFICELILYVSWFNRNLLLGNTTVNPILLFGLVAETGFIV